MPGPPFVHGEQIDLHTVTPADYEFVHRNWNQPSNRRGTNRHAPRSPDEVKSFFEADGDAVHLLPCLDGEPLGLIWVFRVADAHGRAEVGYWIARDHRGAGHATAALELATTWAFEERGLRKLSARVLGDNQASKRVLEKAGFEKEATLPAHYRQQGEYVDAHLYGRYAAGSSRASD
jgi:RimJ/RimL family protein N-acetyltransferase